jgi:hypothetical protein
MKFFAIAFGIGCGVGVILSATTFAVLTLVGVAEAVAVPAAITLAGPPLVASKEIAELLERQEGKKALAAGKRTPVYDFRGFQIAWPLMVLYGSLIIIGVSLILGGIAGVVGAAMAIASGITEGDLIQEYLQKNTPLWVVALSADSLVSLLVVYLLGRWIGTRCSRGGALAVLLMITLTFVIAIAVGVPSTMSEWYHFIMIWSLLQLPILICFGLIGYWRGRKHRLSKYLHYLLGVLPSETRDTVVELAFDEAQKVASAAGRARISAA